MTRKPLLATLLATSLAGATGLALAQTPPSPPSPPPAPAAPPAPMSHRMGQFQPGMPMHRMQEMRGHMGHGPGMGAMADLRELERLYRQTGRTKDLAGLYNEVLAKSQDPMLRTYAYHHLAELQAQPSNPDQAIATLRKSLEENLANEAKMRAEHQKMRALWEQRAKAKADKGN